MKKRPRAKPLPKNGEPPAPEAEAPMDRFLHFGRALFAVPKDELPKDELPKRDRAEKPKRPGNKPNTAPGG
jgi:hypothetical protein